MSTIEDRVHRLELDVLDIRTDADRHGARKSPPFATVQEARDAADGCECERCRERIAATINLTAVRRELDVVRRERDEARRVFLALYNVTLDFELRRTEFHGIAKEYKGAAE